MKLLHLSLGWTLGLAATGKHIGHAVDRLTLPGAHLVRMRLIPCCDLLDRLVATRRLKRDLRFELICELPAFRHLVSLQQVRDTP